MVWYEQSEMGQTMHHHSKLQCETKPNKTLVFNVVVMSVPFLIFQTAFFKIFTLSQYHLYRSIYPWSNKLYLNSNLTMFTEVLWRSCVTMCYCLLVEWCARYTMWKFCKIVTWYIIFCKNYAILCMYFKIYFDLNS